MTQAGARDPRDFYRRSLMELRSENPEAYEQAVAHFQDVLVPSIARGEAEPLTSWREYGRLIAEATAKGETVAIDESGISHPYEPAMPMDLLVLHMPDAKGGRSILVSLPPHPSPAQRATYDLLVAGKHKLTQVE